MSDQSGAMQSCSEGAATPARPLAIPIRVSTVGGPPPPLQEALVNINSLVTGPLNLSPGYESYTKRILLLHPTEYDTSIHDDLSADEAYEIPVRETKVCLRVVWESAFGALHGAVCGTAPRGTCAK